MQEETRAEILQVAAELTTALLDGADDRLDLLLKDAGLADPSPLAVFDVVHDHLLKRFLQTPREEEEIPPIA